METMKQHITKEQWGELSEKQQEMFFNWMVDNNYGGMGNKPTIGQMIEFLGDDLVNIALFSFKDKGVKKIRDIIFVVE